MKTTYESVVRDIYTRPMLEGMPGATTFHQMTSFEGAAAVLYTAPVYSAWAPSDADLKRSDTQAGAFVDAITDGLRELRRGHLVRIAYHWAHGGYAGWLDA